MGVNIEFLLPPTLKHINLRKEGDEEFSCLCADLKIEGTARIGPNGEMIQRLLGCTADEAFSFWLPGPVSNDGPDPAFTGIEQIKSWASFAEGHELQIAGLLLRPSKLHKFGFKPRAGHLVELCFTASVREITDSHLTHLSEKLMLDVKCKVVADPDLFDGLDEGEANDPEK